jgi:hypothetical protein
VPKVPKPTVDKIVQEVVKIVLASGYSVCETYMHVTVGGGYYRHAQGYPGESKILA